MFICSALRAYCSRDFLSCTFVSYSTYLVSRLIRLLRFDFYLRVYCRVDYSYFCLLLINPNSFDVCSSFYFVRVSSAKFSLCFFFNWLRYSYTDRKIDNSLYNVLRCSSSFLNATFTNSNSFSNCTTLASFSISFFVTNLWFADSSFKLSSFSWYSSLNRYNCWVRVSIFLFNLFFSSLKNRSLSFPFNWYFFSFSYILVSKLLYSNVIFCLSLSDKLYFSVCFCNCSCNDASRNSIRFWFVDS